MASSRGTTHGEHGFLYQRPAAVGRGHLPGGSHRKGTAAKEECRGAMELYNDKPQLIVNRIRRCEPQEYTASDFYPASIRDPEEMFGEVETFVAMVRDEHLRREAG